jgi:DNA polymerase (family 10)
MKTRTDKNIREAIVPIHNSDVADIFTQMADLLEIQGSNVFRVRAYRNAARTVGGLSQSVEDLVMRDEDLTRLPGIGKDLAEKIGEIVKTGRLSLLEKLKGELPPGLSNLMKIGGLGPKRVRILHDKLDITNLASLKKATAEKKIRKLPGFGEKTEQTIMEELDRVTGEGRRMRISVAEEIADSLVEYLKKSRGIKEITVAGSYRRRKETIGDLDILATSEKSSDIMDRFVAYGDVEKVLSKGETRSSVLLRTGVHVDLRVVPDVSYGAAMHYFTGSKAHNIAIRTLGVKKGLKINEYGVFRGSRRIAGRTEDEVFRSVGLPFIPPEMREGQGEIEAAMRGQLPRLLTLKEIRGDLHVHTSVTDGRNTLEEMAAAAKKRGYRYMAITEHSRHVTVAQGLKPEGLARRIKEIDRFNAKSDILILRGIEVDILEDGTLDLPDDILKELDLTVCAVHYKFNLSREKQTERIIRAMDNPYFNILAHPTGRLINERRPYEVDMERLILAAKERGCFMELNAHPLRLDLRDADCKMAKDIGMKVAISTDAHSIGDLDLMRFGVGQARRGWLEAGDVLNTRNWEEMKKLLARK